MILKNIDVVCKENGHEYWYLEVEDSAIAELADFEESDLIVFPHGKRTGLVNYFDFAHGSGWTSPWEEE
jgi:hypothetical protein